MTVEVCFECDIANCYHIRARRAAKPDVAQAARVLLDHYDKPDCVEAVSRDFTDTLHGMIMLHSRVADGETQ